MKIPINKNINIVLSAGLFIVAGLTSCEKSDLLNREPASQINQANYYTLPDHAESGLNAIYGETRSFYQVTGGIFSGVYQMLEAPTGTTRTETGQSADQNALHGLTYDGNTSHIAAHWNNTYRLVAQANLVITRVPAITPMDEGQKKRVLGQAKFLRAWTYFRAVQLWGDIPLITEPQTTSSPDFFPTRAPKEEVYKLIVQDLVDAEAAGLPWTDPTGRITMAAVKSLLAKVYLTMAGFPLNKGTSHYQLAASKALEVITHANANPTAINLFPTYLDVHDETKDNRLEHIFMVQYNNSQEGNPFQASIYPNSKPVSTTSGNGSFAPTQSFYNSYDDTDLRKRNQQGWFYTSYFTNGTGAPLDLGAPYIFKHFNIASAGSPGRPATGQNHLNVPVIRYAEVLLIYAEAQNEVTGPNPAAYAAFKRIRDRAQLVTPDISTYTQSTFREAVWRERWHELAFEQITWFDMVRLRKVFNETTKGFDNFVGHVNQSTNQALQEKHLLFPIPATERLNNPNLNPQNPGYSN
ncbi:MAG TPA: RagB/SusD family nutrient uptake outer membrane protein [Flavisolibacter sp.]|nr:RagB/SusD family nutrient uptake outer membrane protein [Flavisolibacter sp.]